MFTFSSDNSLLIISLAEHKKKREIDRKRVHKYNKHIVNRTHRKRVHNNNWRKPAREIRTLSRASKLK